MTRIAILRIEDDAATHLPKAYAYETPGETLDAHWTLPADDQILGDLARTLKAAETNALGVALAGRREDADALRASIARLAAAAGLDTP